MMTVNLLDVISTDNNNWEPDKLKIVKTLYWDATQVKKPAKLDILIDENGIKYKYESSQYDIDGNLTVGFKKM